MVVPCDLTSQRQEGLLQEVEVEVLEVVVEVAVEAVEVEEAVAEVEEEVGFFTLYKYIITCRDLPKGNEGTRFLTQFSCHLQGKN